VIDRHPSYPQIVIGACCSGHAFKYSTLIGDILVDLAVEGVTSRDIEMFAMSRFNVPA
jgi:glycine/D-amino acid oxidase-like deaminating enzyme